MGKKIVIADNDTGYLSGLEWFFCKQSKGDMEIMTISNADYLHTFFSKPQTVDGLLISERLYFDDLRKHNISQIFLLSEDGSTTLRDCICISKYETSMTEMYNKVLGYLGKISDEQQIDETTVVLVYSPIGGSGATSVAVGLCACLEHNFQNTLFLDAGSLQSTSSFFSEEFHTETWQKELFDKSRTDRCEQLKLLRRHEVCDFLPPYTTPLFTIPLCAEDYIALISSIKEEKAYNFVVVTMDSAFNEDVSAMLGFANKVVIVYENNESAVHKLNTFLKSINFSDPGRFSFVCNRFRAMEDHLPAEISESGIDYSITKIGYYPDFPRTISEMRGSSLDKIFQRITDAVM